MDFKEWLLLTENGDRTGAKIGLYPSIMDILGQYPPLWGIPRAADMITYYNINYPNGVPSENGIVRYQNSERKFTVHHHLHPSFKHHEPSFQKAAGQLVEKPAHYDLPPD